MSDPATHRPLPFRALLELGIAAGLLTGLGETALLLVKRFLRHRFITVGEHALWMAPIADTLLFAAITLGFLLLTRSMAPARRERLFAALLVTLGLTTMLTLWGRFHWVATVLLSLGIAIRLRGWLAARLWWWHRAGLRALPVMVLLVLLTAGAVVGERKWKERENIAGVAAPGQPNILLIILDTVRSMSLGLYGHHRANTPELTRWAERGTVFEHAFAPSSWTLPSHAAMFTGRWQTELTVLFNRPLSRRWPTLAEELGDRGYASGGFVANLIYTPRESGLARGFSHYEDFGLNRRVFARSATLLRKLFDRPRIRWELRPHRPALWKPGPEVTAGALRWIIKQEGRPWFAFLNYMEAHDPWYVPDGFDTLYGPGALHIEWDEISRQPMPGPETMARFEEGYDAAIAWLDREVGGLLDSLERGGQMANTVVVITSDHGEELGEHNFLGHGATLYRPVVEIPLIVITPGCRAGVRQAQPVSLRDFPATVMDLLGTADHPFPGQSFAPLFCRPAAGELGAPVFSVLKEARGEGSPTLVSVIADSLRYIGDGRSTGELFNFRADPTEQHDLSRQQEWATDARRLRALTDSLRTPTWND